MLLQGRAVAMNHNSQVPVDHQDQQQWFCIMLYGQYPMLESYVGFQLNAGLRGHNPTVHSGSPVFVYVSVPS